MSLYNEVDITEGGGLAIQGSLPDPLPLGLDGCLKGFILQLNAIRVQYAKMLESDNKIAGHERLELTKNLDAAMNFIVLARSKIENKSTMTAHVMKFNHRLQISIQDKKWIGQGHLGQFRQIKTHDFPIWLSRIQKERLPNLITFLGKAAEDGKLDAKEKIILARSIDRIIFSILIVRESILNTQLD